MCTLVPTAGLVIATEMEKKKGRTYPRPPRSDGPAARQHSLCISDALGRVMCSDCKKSSYPGSRSERVKKPLFDNLSDTSRIRRSPFAPLARDDRDDSRCSASPELSDAGYRACNALAPRDRPRVMAAICGSVSGFQTFSQRRCVPTRRRCARASIKAIPCSGSNLKSVPAAHGRERTLAISRP